MLRVICWSQGPFLRHSQLLSEWKGAGEDVSSPFGDGYGGEIPSLTLGSLSL